MAKNNKSANYDIEFVKFLCEKGYSNYAISQIIGVKKENISSFISVNKIKKKKINTISFTPNQVEIILKMYSDGKAMRSIADSFEVSVDVVWRLFKLLKVETREPNSKIYKHKNFNHSAFLNMEDEEACYFYGLLLADGCLCKNKSGKYNRVSIALKDEDKYMLERLLTYLGMDSKPHYREYVDSRTNNLYKLNLVVFNDTEIVKRLTSYGFSPRKSAKEVVPPESIASNKHFWRGMIDGDGCLSIDTNGNLRVNLVGSYDITCAFNKFVEANIDVITKRRIVDRGNLFSVEFSGADARNTAKLLYEGSTIYLTRKYEKACKYF